MKTMKTKKIKVIDQVFCDNCEKEIVYDNLSLNYTFGYSSKIDNTNISLDICDDCLEKILGNKLMKKGISQGKN